MAARLSFQVLDGITHAGRQGTTLHQELDGCVEHRREISRQHLAFRRHIILHRSSPRKTDSNAHNPRIRCAIDCGHRKLLLQFRNTRPLMMLDHGHSTDRQHRRIEGNR